MIDKYIYKILIANDINISNDVFYYGWSILKQYLLFLLIIIPISCYHNLFYEIIYFFVIYTPLRKNIGGFHFNNKYFCVFFSAITSFLIVYISNLYNPSLLELTFIFFLLIIMTYIMAPVDNINKKLNIKEKNVYKRKSLIIEFIYYILSIILFLYDKIYLINLIYFTDIITLISITIAFIIKRS